MPLTAKQLSTATQILPWGCPNKLGVDGHCGTHLLLSLRPKYV